MKTGITSDVVRGASLSEYLSDERAGLVMARRSSRRAAEVLPVRGV